MDRKKKGKKIAAVLLAAVLIIVILLCLVQCQSGGGEADPVETTGATTATTEAAGEPTSEATEGIEPTTEPTEVTEEPTEEPTEVTEEPTEEPTEAPTEETTKPTENAVEPTEHVHEYSEKVVEATCTDRGYTIYSCQCGDTYKDNFTDALGHNWGSWVVTKEATEAAKGLEERKCGRCSATETRELPKVVPNHEHTYVSKETKKATCTAEGVMTYTCSCGDTYTESIPKLGHSYSAKETQPTCTDKGYTTHTCSRCKDAYTDSYTNATGHSYTGKVTTEATCTKEGVKTYTCTKCGDKKTESISALGHEYSDTVVKPTCTAKGYTLRTCKRSGCNYSNKFNYTEATGHNYSAVVTKPTYTAGGYTTYTCKTCGYSYKGNYTDKLEPKPTEPAPTEPTPTEPAECSHNYVGKVTTAATCTTKGVKTYTCSKCGDKKTESISPLNHSLSTTVKDATCTADGSKTTKCTRSGCTYKTVITIPALGHNLTLSERVEATCCTEGYESYKCSRCSTVSKKSLPCTAKWVHHHQDEVGHYKWVWFCHCGGWSCEYDDPTASFAAHKAQFESSAGHSYYEDRIWVIDIPGYDYYECSGCGRQK